MKISIIIPIYNAELLLERCIESVLANKSNFDLEIIVIDDGSTDKSVEILNEKYPRVILLQQENLGPAAARNKGIEHATGVYLAFLDADDYWFPDFLSKTSNFFEKYPSAVAVSVGQKHYLPNGKKVVAPRCLENSKEDESILINDFFKFWALHNHVCTGSVLMRTETVKRTGGQRIDLRITEDLEFWAYLSLYGKWGFIPQVLFVSDGRAVTQQITWIEKNRKRWASAPTIDSWESRIKEKLPIILEESYLIKRGQIVRNLVYSMLLDGKLERARIEILQNSKFLPLDKLSWLLRIGALIRPIWFVLAQILFLREKYRKI